MPLIKGVVVELGEHEMCIMQPGITDSEHDKLGRCCSILSMTTFRVEKLHHDNGNCM